MKKTYCSAVESYECEAPAGYRTGMGTASCPPQAGLLECAYCGEPVCRKCSDVIDDRTVCLSHPEDELMWWLNLQPEEVQG